MYTTKQDAPSVELQNPAKTELQKKLATTGSVFTTAECEQLRQELHVHQIELESQRAALAQARAQLERNLKQYSDLYDFAPVGYFTLSDTGVLLETNFVGAALLGEPRLYLLGRCFESFISVETRLVFKLFLDEMLRGEDSRESCEIALSGGKSSLRHVRLEGVSVSSSAGRCCRIAAIDVTAHLQFEETLRKTQERLELALDSADMGFYDVNLKTGEVVTDERLQHILGFDADEVALPMQGRLDSIHPADRLRVFQLCEETVKGLRPGFKEDYRIRHPSGVHLWVLDRCKGFHQDESGRPQRITGTVVDITARKTIEDALRASQENFHNVVQKNRTGILLVDEQGDILFANPAAETLLGRSSSALVGSQFGIPAVDGKTEMNILRPNHGQGIAEMIASETQWQGCRAYLLMLHDITEHKENEARIKQLAYHDSLTGLPNRALFADRFNQAILRARRNQTKIALLFIDLNRFKEINDTLGHKTGDLLLKATADRLSQSIRKSDTVARMGGDEFTILLEGLNSQEEARELAQKIQRAFEKPMLTGTRELFTTPSIGISLYPDHATHTETLLRQADSAMYSAKRCKNAHICFYSEEATFPADDGLTLETHLRRALEHQEFVLYYQVQVDLKTHRLTGMEALLRWRHPDRGLLFPTDFMPTLEETGLIVPVGVWILTEVCRQAQAWREIGIEPVPIAVNVSTKQLLMRDQFVSTVQNILADSEIDPNLLRLELTESAVIQEQARTLHTLRALRNLGVHLHMDDFGAGYSSFAYLKHLPFDIVKVDQGFIADLLVDPDDALLTQAIIAMAHSLKKQVVAEGVETQEQAEFLRNIGCDYAQGWLYGRALSAQDMEECLRNPSKHL